MTDAAQGNPAKASELAQQIVKLLINEDSETRRRAISASMLLLGETAPLEIEREKRAKNDEQNDNGDCVDIGEFFNREENLKPSDHAQLCAAYHFSTYGFAAFSLDELRTIAGDTGVVLPDRLDMTLTAATRNGKKLFQSAGRGLFKPTAAGGLVFKEQWGVKPGKKAKGQTSTTD